MVNKKTSDRKSWKISQIGKRSFRGILCIFSNRYKLHKGNLCTV